MKTPIVVDDCGRFRGRDQAMTIGLGGRSSRELVPICAVCGGIGIHVRTSAGTMGAQSGGVVGVSCEWSAELWP